ncbi:uncharacterized protein PFL1_04436 [Pseudozyma flocculosa PF-1]|uniref:Uncharacterized protein n=1 Tax=Pseudozyma flocculosa PF-1 TaxID=1277687 RepID=A0A061H6M3_9BASI|nr:uncharacterized protein PFL1_04436 [Pseudozyma flocculosa PF-1]EPQ28109.1 hypothetical protein PFL1_04436 [Pseudozyma flocculosa PF-1]
MAGNASRRAGSTSGRSIPKEGPAASTKLVRKLLKKIFDLEPEVLDAFLSRDASVDHVDGRPRPLSTSLSSSRDLAGPGFSHERGLDAPLAHIPAPPRRAGSSSGDERQQMLHVGRSADDQASEDASDEDGEGSKTPRASLHESQDWQRQDVALINSPLFDLTTAATELGLTAEALSRRRTSSGGSRQSQQVADGARSMLEPTTIEALQALVNSMMPVPMPFRILGALARSLGWSRSFWGGGGQDADEAASREQAEGEAAELPAVLDDDRRYRYDRLLSVQQAKAWSRRYRGIQLANDQPEDSSIDVPECWRGDEHPALAGNSP